MGFKLFLQEDLNKNIDWDQYKRSSDNLESYIKDCRKSLNDLLKLLNTWDGKDFRYVYDKVEEYRSTYHLNFLNDDEVSKSLYYEIKLIFTYGTSFFSKIEVGVIDSYKYLKAIYKSLINFKDTKLEEYIIDGIDGESVKSYLEDWENDVENGQFKGREQEYSKYNLSHVIKTLEKLLKKDKSKLSILSKKKIHLATGSISFLSIATIFCALFFSIEDTTWVQPPGLAPKSITFELGLIILNFLWISINLYAALDLYPSFFDKLKK